MVKNYTLNLFYVLPTLITVKQDKLLNGWMYKYITLLCGGCQIIERTICELTHYTFCPVICMEMTNFKNAVLLHNF